MIMIMTAYIKILRPVNSLLASIGVALGFWLTGVAASLTDLLLLIITTICALGYGNVINDIKDAEGDRINHPDRPIPKGEISQRAAVFYACALAIISLICSYTVSSTHCIAACIPLVLLTLYTLYLKATPLVGNILISMLVAYTLVFGSIHSPDIGIILIPAFLAFLLNFSREVVKDIQDKEGDLQAGIRTTAILPEQILKPLLIGICALYLLVMFVPVLLGHFHLWYLLICTCVVLPIHIFWFVRILHKDTASYSGKISTAIKIEMAGGLCALAVDKLFTYTLSFW